MGADTPTEGLLRRVDSDIRRAVAGQERAIIAFSGGLASLILAALVRKRCDVTCEVVGLPGSADAESAVVAEKFLDYPVRIVRPAPMNVLRAARAIVSADARLSPPAALSLVPLALVEARHPRERILSGFGLTWDSSPVRSFLRSRSTILPGLQARTAAPPSRFRLLRVADLLGLPESFFRAARRTPAEGSGIGPSIRAMAHAEHASVARLLASGIPLHDYHGRAATRVIPKSSPVD